MRTVKGLARRVAAFAPPAIAGWDHYYLGTYKRLLRTFEEVTFAEGSSLESDACVWFVTSWMRLQKNQHWENYQAGLAYYERARPVLVKARSEGAVTFPDDLKTVRAYLGGSMIAASKFLHFLRPDRFAMWDQNVAEAMFGNKRRDFLNSPKQYACYLGNLALLDLPDDVDRNVRRVLGDVTLIRRKEFVLFCLGRHRG